MLDCFLACLLFICSFICVFVCLLVCLFVCLSVCLFVCLLVLRSAFVPQYTPTRSTFVPQYTLTRSTFVPQYTLTRSTLVPPIYPQHVQPSYPNIPQHVRPSYPNKPPYPKELSSNLLQFLLNMINWRLLPLAAIPFLLPASSAGRTSLLPAIYCLFSMLFFHRIANNNGYNIMCGTNGNSKVFFFLHARNIFSLALRE